MSTTAPAEPGTRQDTHRVTVTITDKGAAVFPKPLVFDKRTGGELDSEEYKFKPGGMGVPVSLGGTKTAGNVTLQRLYRPTDHTAWAAKILAAVGRGKVVVSDQPLDIDGNPFGNPVVWNGILKRVAFPEHDSESSNAGLVEIEVSPEGYPTI